ncbi:MAG: serine hydrolase domain-containing protein [Actinomycetaceae bacterium]|nr:serine hydrolase domain-containing protein [Actinomycetaceae bacterium]
MPFDSLENRLSAIPFPYALAVSRPLRSRSPGQRVELFGDISQVFPWASVSKLVTSFATWKAVEDGLMTFSDPPGEPCPPGSTLADLLGHTTGLAFASNHLSARLRTHRIYSNRGFELVGQMVEKATRMTISQWVAKTVTEPLEMTRTQMPGSPADSMRGTITDLLTFAQELAKPTLISRDMWALVQQPWMPGLSGVLPGYGRQNDNLWGMGIEIRGRKTPHWTPVNTPPYCFGHFGQSGSFLLVNPLTDTVIAFLGAQPFGDWHKENWPDLIETALAR